MKRALRFTAHALSKVGPCHCLPLHALKNTGLKNLRIKELNYQACYTSVIILSMCVCVLYKLACIPIRSWYSAFFPKYLIPYRIFQKLKPNSISKSGNLVSIRYGIPTPHPNAEGVTVHGLFSPHKMLANVHLKSCFFWIFWD